MERKTLVENQMEIMRIKKEIEARQEKIDKQIEENLAEELNDLPDMMYLQ